LFKILFLNNFLQIDAILCQSLRYFQWSSISALLIIPATMAVKAFLVKIVAKGIIEASLRQNEETILVELAW